MATKNEKLDHKSAIGAKATIERETMKGDKVIRYNKALRELGAAMADLDDSLKHATYTGSAAVHYYMFPTVRHPFFLTQASTIGQTSELVVQNGITDLRNELLQQYGHSPQRVRSGF